MKSALFRPAGGSEMTAAPSSPGSDDNGEAAPPAAKRRTSANTPLPPPVPVASVSMDASFFVGQRVEARHGGKSKWYGATVMQINEGGETLQANSHPIS